jgi:hypothetical protein
MSAQILIYLLIAVLHVTSYHTDGDVTLAPTQFALKKKSIPNLTSFSTDDVSPYSQIVNLLLYVPTLKR